MLATDAFLPSLRMCVCVLPYHPRMSQTIRDLFLTRLGRAGLAPVFASSAILHARIDITPGERCDAGEACGKGGRSCRRCSGCGSSSGRGRRGELSERRSKAFGITRALRGRMGFGREGREIPTNGVGCKTE